MDSANRTWPRAESLIVLTGLPRSGTSMLMQMLAAGGMHVLSEGLREADEDNPRGYLEFEPVKNLLKDSKWLFEGRGRVIKIVAPLLAASPPGLPCRVILSERDLEDVLDSQERMLVRRNQPLAATPERRRMLKEEYARTLGRVKDEPGYATAADRTQPGDFRWARYCRKSEQVSRRRTDVAKMAAAVDPTLHRNRTGISG